MNIVLGILVYVRKINDFTVSSPRIGAKALSF